jgi:hypothetical protein
LTHTHQFTGYNALLPQLKRASSRHALQSTLPLLKHRRQSIRRRSSDLALLVYQGILPRQAHERTHFDCFATPSITLTVVDLAHSALYAADSPSRDLRTPQCQPRSTY